MPCTGACTAIVVRMERRFAMSRFTRRTIHWLSWVVIAGWSGSAAVAQTAFTYQGELRDGDALVHDARAIVFSLYEAEKGGPQLGWVSLTGVTFAGGRFSVPLDFGANVFNGQRRWLEI